VDLDREIERVAGRGIPAIFAEGEERFRDLETLALAEALGLAERAVVACGGGVLGRAANRDLLRARALVVWLTVDPSAAAARLRGSGSGERPLLSGGSLEERLGRLLEQRGRGYAEVADRVVETDGAPEAVAERIANELTRSGLPWDSSAS
jgi:shikimate kinase